MKENKKDKEMWLLLESEMDCLVKLAEKRYKENSHKDMEWVDKEARWHIYKAIDQLSISSYHYRNDNLGKYEVNMADAFNHMVMAMLTYTNLGKEKCHPIMGDE